MHFDAACQRILLTLTVAAGRADSGCGPYQNPTLPGEAARSHVPMACLIV